MSDSGSDSLEGIISEGQRALVEIDRPSLSVKGDRFYKGCKSVICIQVSKWCCFWGFYKKYFCFDFDL
ncbi:hypothetical protein YC2023_002923 [Brassica napus]